MNHVSIWKYEFTNIACCHGNSFSSTFDILSANLKHCPVDDRLSHCFWAFVLSVVLCRCYWTFHGHFSREAEQLFQALESSYQKALQSHIKSSDSILSLPASDRSSSSSQESLK